jgi:acetoacetyl-CoA synthetase
VVDRFSQTSPKVLIACDGYWYAGKRIDITDKLKQIVAQLPSLQRVVIVPLAGLAIDVTAIAADRGITLEDYLHPYVSVDTLEFAQLPFDHPLYIMYSSGTTGVPKCIVHGAGGTLLQHLKEHRLHSDLREHDRLFYFTTCGWMMWNWLVSGLASGATLLLYDGNPMVDDGQILWNYAQQEKATHFGTSAKYLELINKSGLKPGQDFELSDLRMLLSTGSPLAPESFDYVYRDIKSDLQLSSISGGTDIISCFVLGNPILPVWRGEIQCKGLGMAVEVWDEQGRSIDQGKGELVCTSPFPSMPIGFWNDPDGSQYRRAYYQRFNNVWCHGDYCEITQHGGMVIHGRSDATLNPGGVRIGTAEIYRQVEKLPEVLESVIIGQQWQGDVRVILFVKLADGLSLSDELVEGMKTAIRANTTARHVPAKVLQVKDIPHTKSGKIVELAVRNVVHGQPVANVEALANPQALDEFKDRAELQQP